MTHYGVQVGQYLRCWYPNDADALGSEPRIARRIAFRSIAAFMRFTVHLDGEAVSGGEEVEDIFPRRMLAPETQSRRVLSKGLP